jgi:hypothetical protein
MKFKFNPDKTNVARLIERNPKMLLANMTIGQFVEKPSEIPDQAIRPGTYLIRYGKGQASEFEYISSLEKWFSKGRVYVQYGYNPDWHTLPCLTDSELEAMRKVGNKLTIEWQRVLVAYDEMRSREQHRRRARLHVRKILSK